MFVIARLTAIGLVFFLLSACGGTKATLVPFDINKAPDAQVERVLVATSRKASSEPGMLFMGERSDTITFMDFSINIPKDRQLGSLEYPTSPPDPETQFISLQQSNFASDNAFIASVNADLRSRPQGKRAVLVFTHGYNVSFPESVFRMAQIKQDFEFDGLGILYSWPSAASTPLYAYDRDSQLFAREGLAELIALLAKSQAEEIFVLGHSMGGLLTMEAVRTLALAKNTAVLDQIDGVFLASPDIDVDVFRQQMSYIDPKELPIIVMGSGADRALKVSSFVTGGHPRVGSPASIEELRRLGVVVIDTTGVDDSASLGHSDFATSPTLLKLIQNGTLATAALHASSSSGLFVQGVSLLTNTAATLVYLPIIATGQ